MPILPRQIFKKGQKLNLKSALIDIIEEKITKIQTDWIFDQYSKKMTAFDKLELTIQLETLSDLTLKLWNRLDAYEEKADYIKALMTKIDTLERSLEL